MHKPTFHQGRRLPFHELEPSEFNRFAFAVFDGALGRRMGLTVTSKPAEGPDGGYDVHAYRTSTDEAVCIQCKNVKKLSIPTVATELAKVGMQCALDNIVVREHIIVASAALNGNLVTALQEPGQSTLLARVTRETLENSSLSVRRKRLQEVGIDPVSVVEAHIERIGRPEVWSGEMFDQKLGSCFTELSDIIERYFAVHAVLREHPRPEFDELRYLECQLNSTPPWMEVGIQETSLPPTLWAAGSASRVQTPPLKSLVDLLPHLRDGSACLVLAPGGGGKTTGLAQICKEASRRRLASLDAPLPIRVSLAAYSGSLDSRIHSSLQLRSGSWHSIPGPKLLLLDGIDRMQRSYMSAFSQDVKDLLRSSNVSVLLSCRTGGPQYQTEIPPGTSVFEIQPPSGREVTKLAKQILADQSSSFLSNLWAGATTHRLLRLPFGIIETINIYEERGSIPRSEHDLVSQLVEGRLKVNERRHSVLSDDLARISTPAVRRLAEELAFQMRIIQGRLSCSDNAISATLTQAIAKARQQVLRIGNLDPDSGLVLLRHYEFIRRTDDAQWEFVHDIFADLLASTSLAQSWQQHLDSLHAASFDDLWTFTAPQVRTEELALMLNAMLKKDVLLGARCARAASSEKLLEQRIIELSHGATLFYEHARTAAALATLNTAKSLQTLERRAERGKDDNGGWTALVSLARSGHKKTVEKALTTADSDRRGPMEISGGWTYLAEISAPGRLLEVARHRVQNHSKHDCLSSSIDFIAAYGDEDDLRAVELALTEASDPLEVVRGMYALHEISAASAFTLARTALATGPRWISMWMARFLCEHGQPVSSYSMLNLLLTSIFEKDDPDPDPDEYVERGKLTEVLCDVELSESCHELLDEALTRATHETRYYFLRIASAHKLDLFAGQARALLSPTNHEEARRQALSYLLSLHPTDSQLSQYLLHFRDLTDRDSPSQELRAFPPLFSLVKGTQGQTEALSLLKRKIECLLAEIEAKSEDRRHSEHNIKLAGLLDLMAEYAKELPFDLCARVLSTRGMQHLTNAKPLATELFAHAATEKVDHLLLEMEDHWNATWLLAIAAQSTPTPAKEETLLRLFERPLHPALTKQLCESLNLLWSDKLMIDVVTRLVLHNPEADDFTLQISVTEITKTIASNLSSDQTAFFLSEATKPSCHPEIAHGLRNLAALSRRLI
tara:strand:+ start:25349 stop:28915 length:3567 start_codon:yes stop_codon:yes gene_type:complete